jgi:hypothetical protein
MILCQLPGDPHKIREVTLFENVENHPTIVVSGCHVESRMTERDGCRHPVFGRRLEESDDGIELDEILGLDDS